MIQISTIPGYPDIFDPATSFIGKQDFQMIDETLPQQQQHQSRYWPARQKSDIIVYKILETLQSWCNETPIIFLISGRGAP